MSNIIVDISKIYSEQIISESTIQPPMEKLKTDRNMFQIPDDEKEAARQRTLAKAKAMREKKMKEDIDIEEETKAERYKRLMATAATPAQKKAQERQRKGREVLADIQATEKALKAGKKSPTENKPEYNTPEAEVRVLKPGQKKDTLALKAKKAMSEEKKAKRWWDDDGDGKGWEEGEVSGKFKKKKKVKEELDPVGKEDDDIDNDGTPNTKSDKYLKNRRKVRSQVIAKEGFSNWREDLIEVVSKIEDKDGREPKVVEKKVNNTIKINPNLNLGETISELGGTILEMSEIESFEGVLDDLSESEIFLLSEQLIEEVVEEFFYECIEEGYDILEVESQLLESLEISSSLLTEAKVTLGHDTKIKSDRLEKVKSAVKKVGKVVAKGAGYAAGSVVRGAKAVRREFSAGYQRGKQGSGGQSSSDSFSSGSSSTSSKSGSSMPGLLRRIGSALKSGLKRAVAKGARAVSRGARNVARRMESGSSSTSSKSTATSKPKPKGTSATGTKSQKPKAPAAAKTAAKPAAKKKKSNRLDDLLSDIRSEETCLDEKTLTYSETNKKEEIVKSMKSKAKDFEKRYPGRGKEVMYATATKMAKRMAEQAMEIAPKTQQSGQQDQKSKIASQRAKQTAINLKQREIQALRSTPAGTQVSGFGG